MWLIYGGKGWIGSLFIKYLQNKKYILGKERCENKILLEKEILNCKPTYVLCCIGRIKGDNINNIDFLEDNHEINIRDNYISPKNIFDICEKYKIHCTYIGTGCIYNGFDKIFEEEDEPNFFESAYSKVKAKLDNEIRNKYKFILNCRIRLPISNNGDSRCLITKLKNYKNVTNIPNSVTFLPEAIPEIIRLTEKKIKGTLNVVNPGTITNSELLKYFNIEHKIVEENLICQKVKRSNVQLKTSNFLKLNNIKEIFNKNMKTILITGGCGFIGSHFVEHILKNTQWNIVIIDKLSYASYGFNRLKNIGAINNDRVKIFTWDLCCKIEQCLAKEIGEINYIVHMAAETHVDNSISDPVNFIQNNVMSTVQLLEYARTLKNLEIFFYFSTDEVYGPALGDKMFMEDERHNPTNPYSASKSSAEMICMSYHNTYKIPVMRINVMNAFGEMQHEEKFIPKAINKILKGEVVHIHSYPNKKDSGTRFYIHARNIAAGVLFLIKNGKIGESYNLTGEKEISNLEMAQMIAKIIDKELKYEMVDFHSSRPGHDLRYGLSGKKMEDMGWELPVNFEKSLEKTVKWELLNKKC